MSEALYDWLIPTCAWRGATCAAGAAILAAAGARERGSRSGQVAASAWALSAGSSVAWR